MHTYNVHWHDVGGVNMVALCGDFDRDGCTQCRIGLPLVPYLPDISAVYVHRPNCVLMEECTEGVRIVFLCRERMEHQKVNGETLCALCPSLSTPVLLYGGENETQT